MDINILKEHKIITNVIDDVTELDDNKLVEYGFVTQVGICDVVVEVTPEPTPEPVKDDDDTPTPEPVVDDDDTPTSTPEPTVDDNTPVVDDDDAPVVDDGNEDIE